MKKEIYIIDDDPVCRLILSKTIQRNDSSMRITECENGQEGLEKLENIRYADHEIIVLLDINMPVLDGWSFLNQIEKSHLYYLDQLIIYMVSSSIDEADTLKAKTYGFVKGFYNKPLTRDDLHTIAGI